MTTKSASFAIALASALSAGCGQEPTAPASRPEPSLASAAGPLAFTQITNGSSYNCGLTADGAVYCWGINNLGQLGIGNLENQARPVRVAGGTRFSQIDAGGGHICGLALTGRAYCWGWNSTGQLGVGGRTDRSIPTRVAGNLVFRSISAGAFHTCGVTPQNRVYCWGHNKQGQVGDGSDEPVRTTPVPIGVGPRFRVVSADGLQTCAIALDDRAFCWGDGRSGQLGNGSLARQLLPRAVAGGLEFKAISTGDIQRSGNHYFTCGIATDDRAYCWGGNFDGQLGDGTTTDRRRPVAVKGGLRFTRISAGAGVTCGITTAGTSYCWGRNDYGQLGNGGTVGVPAAAVMPSLVTGSLEFVALSTGWTHACGLLAGGAAYCWGSNAFGGLGDGTDQNRSAPVAVLGPG
jgi:alpha-tubulin suppressor-like RCC1 family protein